MRSPLSLLLIDADHFKQINDTYGHLVGDESLIQLAHALNNAMSKPGDLLARYGGEEFAVLLPDTDEDGARELAARLENAVAGISSPIPITVSIGGTTNLEALYVHGNRAVGFHRRPCPLPGQAKWPQPH